MSTGPLVVKWGGAAGLDAAALAAEVAELRAEDIPVVLVHGGSAELERLAGRLNVPLRTLIARDGVATRYTDPATLEVLTLALAGGMKPTLLAELARHGVSSAGATGLDDALLSARRRPAVRAEVDGRAMVVRDDHGGRIVAVRPRLPRLLLDAGMVPVLSPPGITEDGQPVNVNADRMAAAVAAALGARRLVFLTAVGGVLRDPADPASLLDRYVLPPPGVPGEATLTGGMGIKLVAAREALTAGVPSVLVASGERSGTLGAALRGESGTEVVLGGLSPSGSDG